MQKTKGFLTASVQVQGGKIDLLQEIASYLPDTIAISSTTLIPGPHNQNSILYELTYGPVWGGWGSDIKSHFTRAAFKAGTKATVIVLRFKREIVETR